MDIRPEALPWAARRLLTASMMALPHHNSSVFIQKYARSVNNLDFGID
jgi:hypothetical protein